MEKVVHYLSWMVFTLVGLIACIALAIMDDFVGWWFAVGYFTHNLKIDFIRAMEEWDD